MDELTDEKKSQLRERQAELIKLLDAFSKLENSEEWGILKELVFDKSLASIQRRFLVEAMALKVNTDNIYKLQGEWAWAKQYSDPERFAESLKNQLEEIKKILK